MTTPRFELSRGGRDVVRGDRRRPAAASLPNAVHPMPLAAPSDDPAARRRELLVVLLLCRARSRGARERDRPDRALTLVSDG